MNIRQKTCIWLGASLSLVVGVLLLTKDSSAAGMFLIMLGIGSLTPLARSGQSGTGANPTLAKWGLMAIPALVALLVVIVGAIFLPK